MKLTAQEQCTDKNVFLTVLSNERFIPGVRALKLSLLACKTEYKLAVLVPESKQSSINERLTVAGILDEYCFLCSSPDIPEAFYGDLDNTGYWINTFFKLQVANCTQFEKIVLLDSDMIILHNVDELFEAPHYSAVVAGKVFYPEFEELNSGLMVIKPSKELHDQLMNCMLPTIQAKRAMGKEVGDQDVFAAAFPEWKEKEELHLSERYNCFFFLYPYVKKTLKRGEKISIVHFIGGVKPWESRFFSSRTVKELLKLLLRCRFRQLFLYLQYLSLADSK